MSLLFAGVVEVLDVVLAGGELRVGGGWVRAEGYSESNLRLEHQFPAIGKLFGGRDC